MRRTQFNGAIVISRAALLRLRLLYGGKANFVAACRKHARRRAA